MLRKAGNQAYRALAGVLDLPGTQHLGEIDISVAVPVHDLTPVIQAGLVEQWLFVREEAVAGAGETSYTLRPRAAADWDRMVRNGIEVTAAVPTSYDVWITGAFLNSDNSSSFTSAVIYEGAAGVGFANLYIPLQYLAGTLTNIIVPGSQGDTVVGFPWYSPAEGWGKTSLGLYLKSSGIHNVAMGFRAAVAPRGVLPLK